MHVCQGNKQGCCHKDAAPKNTLDEETPGEQVVVRLVRGNPPSLGKTDNSWEPFWPETTQEVPGVSPKPPRQPSSPVYSPFKIL